MTVLPSVFYHSRAPQNWLTPSCRIRAMAARLLVLASPKQASICQIASVWRLAITSVAVLLTYFQSVSSSTYGLCTTTPCSTPTSSRMLSIMSSTGVLGKSVIAISDDQRTSCRMSRPLTSLLESTDLGSLPVDADEVLIHQCLFSRYTFLRCMTWIQNTTIHNWQYTIHC